MLSELLKDQRPLIIAGFLFILGGVVMIALTMVDNTQILGINRWIKPLKFYFSVGIFLWTVAIYLNYLRDHERFSSFVSWAMILIFVIEMAAVTGQAIRGTTSHFNVQNPTDGLIFATMGIAIAINTLLVAAILIEYFRTAPELSPALLWGMRLGLLLFLAGSVQGGYMSAHLAHTVGAADGGPGLPLTNWSTAAGDLRVAHFLGLHSLQAIPLFAAGLEYFRFSNSPSLTVGFAVAYFILFMLLFIQALLGRPLIAL
jgi:hypothetical protein